MGHQNETSKGNARRAGRQANSRSAIVVHGNKHAVMAATFLDISSSGARIKMPANTTLPDSFFVIDPAAETIHLCALMHHTADICGVKFMNRHPLASLPPSLDFLRTVWANFARR